MSADAAAAGRALLRAAGRRRGLLAAGLAAGAVATALPVLAPDPAAGTAVLAAARDLAAGAAVGAEDLLVVHLPADLVPAGALLPGADVVGRLAAGSVRAREPLTDVRLVGPGLLAATGDGLVAVPVRLADPAAAALLRPGDRVDVLAAATGPDGPPAAAVVAAAAPVLAVPASTAAAEGALVVLAASPLQAARLASAEVSSRLSVVVRP